MPGDQRIEQPNPAELDWIAVHLDLARGLAAVHGHDEEDGARDAGALDDVWAEWLPAWRSDPEPADPAPVVNALGTAFGQLLVDRLGLEWAVVTDAEGTAPAVRSSAGDLVVLPTKAVAERLARGETRFFCGLFDAVARQAG